MERRKASIRADRSVLTPEEFDFDKTTFASKRRGKGVKAQDK
jgi:hypothetical protein